MFQIFLLLLFYVVNGDNKKGLSALWNLEKMALCRLNVSAILNYNNYGCWYVIFL